MGLVILIFRKNLFQSIKQGMILGFVYAFAFLTQAIGIQNTSSSNSGFITGLFVITTPLLCFLIFGKRPSKIFNFSLILALLGLWFLTGGISGMNKGDVITLLTPIFIGLYNVMLEKYARKDQDSVVLCFHQLWTMSVICFAAGFLIGVPALPREFNTWLAILYLAIFPACVSIFLQINAQRFVSANRVGIITSLEPVFAAFFAWFFAHEIIKINTIIGGVLIFSSMIISEIFHREEKAA